MPRYRILWRARDNLVRLMGRDDINHYWDYIFAGGIDMIHWALEHGADITKIGLNDYFLVESIFSGGSEVICWVAVNPVIGPHFAYLLQNYEWARRRLLYGYYYNYTPLLKRDVAIYFGSRSPALLLDFAAAKRIRELRIAIQHKAGSRDLCLADHGLLLHSVASCRKKTLRLLAVKFRLSPSDFASVGLKFPL